VGEEKEGMVGEKGVRGKRRKEVGDRGKKRESERFGLEGLIRQG
jgi:hypothetical protein